MLIIGMQPSSLRRLGRLTWALWLLPQVLAGATVAAEEANSKADISGCYTKSSLVVCSSFVLKNTSLLLNCSFRCFSGSFDSTYGNISGIEASVVKTIKRISPQSSLVTSKSRSYHVCKWQQYTTALWLDQWNNSTFSNFQCIYLLFNFKQRLWKQWLSHSFNPGICRYSQPRYQYHIKNWRSPIIFISWENNK